MLPKCLVHIAHMLKQFSPQACCTQAYRCKRSVLHTEATTLAALILCASRVQARTCSSLQQYDPRTTGDQELVEALRIDFPCPSPQPGVQRSFQLRSIGLSCGHQTAGLVDSWIRTSLGLTHALGLIANVFGVPCLRRWPRTSWHPVWRNLLPSSCWVKSLSLAKQRLIIKSFTSFFAAAFAQ